MPSSSQYRSADTPDAVGGDPTTGAASPGRPGPGHAPPPVRVTNVLPAPVLVWTTSELCMNPDSREKPVVGLAGPVGTAGVIRVGGPLGVQRGGVRFRRWARCAVDLDGRVGAVHDRTGRLAAGRDQPAKRDAEPGKNPDDQAADLEPAPAPASGRGMPRPGSGAGRLRHRGVIPFGRVPAGWTRRQATGRTPGRAGPAAAARRGIALRSR